MIRIKVIKASQLALGAALAVLIVVMVWIAISFFVNRETRQVMGPVSQQGAQEILEGAEVASAFASGVQGALFDEDGNTGEDAAGNAGTDGMEIEIVRETEEPAVMKRILIYHTHTHEAYKQLKSDPYKEAGQWRTLDTRYSVVAVGDELASLLTERGFFVIHDTTDHEPPDFNTAYSRSLKTVQGYKESFDVYIDLHRDAYHENEGAQTVTIGNNTMAKIMVLIGTGEGYKEKPYYEENYAFACKLTENVNTIVPGLCKDVMVTKNRYNQNIAPNTILIEVGHNENTLEEAKNAMPYLAEALQNVLTEEEKQEEQKPETLQLADEP